MIHQQPGLARRIGTILVNRIGTVVLVLVVALIGVSIAGYIFEWEWTGLRGVTEDQSKTLKTLWDWLDLLIIPIVLAGGAFWFRQATERVEKEIASRTERERAKETALETYFDRMSELMLDKEDPLIQAAPSSAVQEMAATRTLAVLRRLDDENRRNQVFQFLRDARLLGMREEPVDGMSLRVVVPDSHAVSVLRGRNMVRMQLQCANLAGADLTGTNLAIADLEEAFLQGVILRQAMLKGANLAYVEGVAMELADANLQFAKLTAAKLYATNLERADLYGANLEGADLREAELPEASLEKADLRNANLAESNLTGAKLARADLRGTDLSGANLLRVDLHEANLERTNLKGARKFNCQRLEEAKNWEKAYRDDALACGAEIPEPPEDDNAQRNGET